MRTPPASHAPRASLRRARAYRFVVPAVLVVLALGTVVVLIVAGGVLLGLVPYPGR